MPVYPSSRWARSLAVWGEGGKELWARLAQASLTVPSAETERIGSVAREHGLVLAVGVNELDGGTLYNTLLVFTPDGELALRHRKLMPTNHERMVWGLGDGEGLATIETDLGRVGGLICWENFMPLARAALYESGLDIYLAPTADDSETWQRVDPPHRARGARLRPLVLRLPAGVELSGRRRRSPTARTCSDAAAPRSSARTASTSQARSGTRRESSSPTWSRICSSPSVSASIPQATTRGQTCCGSRSLRFADSGVRHVAQASIYGVAAARWSILAGALVRLGRLLFPTTRRRTAE